MECILKYYDLSRIGFEILLLVTMGFLHALGFVDLSSKTN